MKEKNTLFEETGKKMAPLFHQAISQKTFPGAGVGIARTEGKKKNFFFQWYGKKSYRDKEQEEIVKKNTIYDLASLTKPLVTTLSILCLMKEGKVVLEQTLPSLLEEEFSKEKERITLKDLLSHSSGLPAHRPFFHDLQKIEGVENRKKTLLHFIKKERLDYEIGKKTIYSDLGFMLLGMIVEKKSGDRLDRFAEEKIFKPLNQEEEIFFPQKKNRELFAPTEYCPWRKKIIRGEVSDENCYALGGVSGHAGVFGTVEGVTKTCDLLLDMWKKEGMHPNFSDQDLRFFFQRREEIKNSTWALGFDTPAQEGSSAGKYFSKKSVGHLGFTGTSFWIDPERELVVVLLSNRVHPTRENKKIKDFRPVFHNEIIESLRLR